MEIHNCARFYSTLSSSPLAVVYALLRGAGDQMV